MPSSSGASSPAIRIPPELAALAALLLAAPAAGAPLRFAAKGDWGDGSTAQARVSAAICAAHDARPLAFILTTGDNFYRPDGVATAANWDRPERCTRARGLGWLAAWGNHDLGGDATARVLGAPARAYSVRRGPVRFVVLDGNRPEAPQARRQLIRALARRDAPATIVVVHQPLVTAGFHRGGPVRWKRIVEIGGASLVLQGHNHLYERIRQGGVTYLTTGGGGAALTPCLRIQRGQATCLARHHYVLLSAGPRHIALTARDADDRRLDGARVPVRGGPEDPARVARLGIF